MLFLLVPSIYVARKLTDRARLTESGAAFPSRPEHDAEATKTLK